MPKPYLTAWAAVLTVSLLGCASGTGDSQNAAQKPVVASSVSPITNLVQNVGGEDIRLIGLVPEGSDSHTFEPAPSVARALSEADLVFVNGVGLEEPILRLAGANLKRGARVVSLGDTILKTEEPIYDFSFPRSGGRPNPHLWTNPPYARLYVEEILQSLASESIYKERRGWANNEERLQDRIEELDAAARAATDSIPPRDRKLLTYHDSFPYFARQYGWQIVGAIQPSDFSEPKAGEVAELIEQIKRENVRAIFGSEVFPSPVLEQIARETGARYVDELRDDDLPGEPGDDEHSYVGLIRFDLITIVEALGGDATQLWAVDPRNIVESDASYG